MKQKQVQTTNPDLGSYEIMLQDTFDLNVFTERAKSGLDGYWAICTEDQGDFKRLRGVLLPEYARVFIDIGSDPAGNYAYCAIPINDTLTDMEVLKRVKDLLGGTTIWKDGIEVCP